MVLPPVSNKRVVDFGAGVGRRSVYLYNLPEVTSGHQVCAGCPACGPARSSHAAACRGLERDAAASGLEGHAACVSSRAQRASRQLRPGLSLWGADSGVPGG